MRTFRTWRYYIFNVRTRRLGFRRLGGIKEGELRHCRSLQDRRKGLRKYRSLRDRREKGGRRKRRRIWDKREGGGKKGTAALPQSTGQEEKGLRKYRSLRDRREKGADGHAYGTEEGGGKGNGGKGAAGITQATEKGYESMQKECFCARLKDECALFYNLLALSRLGITWCGEK